MGCDYITVKANPLLDKDSGEVLTNGIKLDLVGVNYKLKSSLNTTNTGSVEGKSSLLINLKNGNNDIEDSDKINIIPGDHLNIIQDENKNYILNGENAVDTFTVAPNAVGNDPTGFRAVISGPGVVGLEEDNKNSLTTVFDPEIKLTAEDTENTTFKFKNGVLSLPIYSRADIDNKLKAVNAMVFCGSFYSVEGTTIKKDNGEIISPIHIGDTYIYLGDTASSINTGETVKKKDLIIATGTEDTSGEIATDLNWVIIPSGDDATVSASRQADTNTTGFDIRYGDDVLLSYELLAGTGIKLETNYENSQKKVTIGHTAVKKTDLKEKKDYSDNQSITIIEPTTVDAQGHVTQITKKTYDIRNTQNKIFASPHQQGDTINTLIPRLKYGQGKDAEDALNTLISLNPIEINSNTLKVEVKDGGTDPNNANSPAKINVELEWGTF